MKNIFVCKLCATIVEDEKVLLNHIVENHTPTDFFQLSFLSEWNIKKPEKKTPRVRTAPKKEPTTEEFDEEEELVIE